MHRAYPCNTKFMMNEADTENVKWLLLQIVIIFIRIFNKCKEILLEVFIIFTIFYHCVQFVTTVKYNADFFTGKTPEFLPVKSFQITSVSLFELRKFVVHVLYEQRQMTIMCNAVRSYIYIFMSTGHLAQLIEMLNQTAWIRLCVNNNHASCNTMCRQCFNRISKHGYT